MRGRSKDELDTTDMMIIQELARDGRMPIMHLAAKVGITHPAVRERLHRLEREGIIKIVAIPVWQFTGSTIEASVGFNVKPGHSVHDAAERLSSYSSFRTVALTTGPYDIVTWAIFDNLEALSAFLRHEVGNIPGIANSETLIHLETVKNVLTYPISETNLRSDNPIPHQKKKQRHRIDELDTMMIEELQMDGRMTVVDLATNVGISRASATKRFQRLLSEGIIMIIAVTKPGSFGYEVTGRIGINAFAGTVDDVARKLASFSAVHFVAVTAGHYDILIGVHFSNLRELSEFIKDELSNIPDIANTESMIYLDVVKRPFEFATANNQYS